MPFEYSVTILASLQFIIHLSFVLLCDLPLLKSPLQEWIFKGEKKEMATLFDLISA